QCFASLHFITTDSNKLAISNVNGQIVKRCKNAASEVHPEDELTLHPNVVATVLQQDHLLRQVFRNIRVSVENVPLHTETVLVSATAIRNYMKAHPESPADAKAKKKLDHTLR